MISELEIENGGEMEGKSRTSRYQVLTVERRNLFRKERLWGYLERSEMKNPAYFRLFKDGRFVGFKRVITEYLPAAATRWQLDSFPHDEDATQSLSRPAMGTATLGREKIVTTEQIRVTHAKSKNHNEPGPVPGSDNFPPMPKVKPPKKDNG